MQDLTFFQGKEAWVGEFLRMLPQDRSILRNYVWGVSHATDANAAHHIGMGLILLTQVAPRFGIFGADGRTPSNLFVLSLAPTGARKTECIKIGHKVGVEAGIMSLVSNTPGSREGFCDTLDDEVAGGMPQQALLYSEFSDFLGITASAGKNKLGGHAATLRDALMKAYDGESMVRTLASRHNHDSNSREITEVGTNKPMVSLIGAANYYVLSGHMTKTDWLNGFMGRFLMFDGEPARYYFRPKSIEVPAVINALQTRLLWERNRCITSNPIYPPCALDAPYTDLYPDAFEMLYNWSHSMHQKLQQESNQLVAAAMSRLDALCMRLALLLSFDYGEAGGWCEGAQVYQPVRPGWRLTVDEIRPAIFIMERHLEAYRYASKHVVLNGEEEPIRDVELSLRHADAANLTLTEGDISRDTSRNDRTVSDALRTLMGRGVVRKTQKESSNQIRYQIIGGISERLLYLPGVAARMAEQAPPVAMTAPAVTPLFFRP